MSSVKARSAFWKTGLGVLLCVACASVAATVPTTVHPSYSLINFRPSAFHPAVGGMGFLSDGRLVIDDWGGDRANQSNRQRLGRVYILGGVTGDNPNVTTQLFASGLEDPLGMAIANDTIHVCGGQNIIRLIDADRDGAAERQDTVFTLPGIPQSGSADSLHPQHGRAEWMFGMLYDKGAFYLNPGSLDPSAAGMAQISPDRGTHLAVTLGNGIRGNFQVTSMGLREPSGMGIGPEGRHCVSDNQGEWLPTNKLICLQPGKFYGAKKGPGGLPYAWDSMPETPATVFLPETEIANSPTAPLYVPNGLYAGQMLMGDVTWGGVQRYFLEKNSQGDYQGCVFTFTGGLEAGVFRMAWGPDGMLYLGMLGGPPDGVFNNQLYGLQKLKFNGDTTFEMLAMRSRPSGMEIEFTKPVDAAIARLASTYTVQTYYYVPSASYGGNKTGTATLTPGTIQISPDGRKVYLPLSGLVARTSAQPQRIVYIKLNGMKSAMGAAPWTLETWYTLNAFGTGNPFDPPTPIAQTAFRTGAQAQLRFKIQGGDLIVQADFQGAYRLRVRDLRGGLIASASGVGPQALTLRVRSAHGRFVVLEAVGQGLRLRRMVELP